MIIVMKPDSQEKDVAEISKTLSSLGLGVHISKGTERTIIGVIGDKRVLSDVPLELMPGVEKLVPIMESYKLASRTFKPEPSIVDVNGVKIGGKELVIMAGPCAVENYQQIMDAAFAVKKAGAQFLRGGAFKPRTSPYSFQGLEEEGLKLLKEAKDATGLQVITEVTSEKAVEIAYKYVDMFQIGARNAQNFHLLREIGRSGKPVLYKRGSATTIEEWLNAAEYIMSEGNYNVVLCERGIRTFETATRNTLDISAVPVVKSTSHLPIIVDPSHAAGKTQFVLPLSKAAIAAGADGLIIEVHPNPRCALSDASQQLTPESFDELCADISKIADIVGREFKHE
ncbi:3-deoxy-7-phosphoheptulonate synthase [Clostridium thermosuccinogenes]|jgi:3-deoxy-7-phosphoheptulonate synthase|uniref:3-deoxy-7-phosphoheptulonate synthase n=1 Tax=Clostridium thermosuccinogenes TaxID=84032 RepID=A0A2K2F872_9CLOT|nr:3-deoxy-7-phosphoheptulonate synthase [Pseudoclostridium thermosuccinogenes]AUS95558.1 3-deoxy-7-phosphoheptulonate synthase [Pseudoclostridium thermosuccinogenes]PNT90419.1 3-deoxy-7-phosphoheptulonate synthase [Pseudoclostridium thermosuccinogenes]PNT94982.1 3-deoxy-7-phosphoheptulonate synthase [Pseudoclostridium thermosuccinogenes]PNT95646.1 3-deoxy-7-phosphoheptulonate synthase [Pseudoclostridium thermosuccinogenes]